MENHVTSRDLRRVTRAIKATTYQLSLVRQPAGLFKESGVERRNLGRPQRPGPRIYLREISGANVIYTPDLATTQGYVLAYDRHKASEAKTAPACSLATLCHTRVASWNHVRIPRKAEAVEARMRLNVPRRLDERPHLTHLPTQHTPCQDLHY